MYQRNCQHYLKKDSFCPPTSLQMFHKVIELSQEEIFGPVLTIQTFRTEDEVIEKANNIPYGLSAGVWTDKGSKYLI
jgi:aldehyde dehydrogenase (NAD+)